MSMSAPYDLITFGETMLRLVPPESFRLGQSLSLGLSFGGAESNVAANLARLGRRVSWWSRLPDNPLAHQLADTLRGHGVSVDDVLFCEGERLGVYYIEYGTAPRGIKVWYDRAHSAASHMQPSHLPDSWLARGRWLHLTGITPALSQSCHDTAQHAVERAKSHGATLSFDVNYREKLWPPTEAGRRLEPFCRAADVVFIARRDAKSLFHVSGKTVDDVARQLQSEWGGTVIVTDGDSGCAGSAGESVHVVPAREAGVIDRIGAGDAFASGVIDRLLDTAPLDEALRFGTALAALKLTIPGDIALVTRDELLQILDTPQPDLHR